MDRLADGFRLIYYDQRGRGRSAEGVDLEEVTLASDIQDLDDLRAHLGLDTTAVLGHSWGGVLAMEYAVRHPDRVSHLIIMNSAPASHEDYLLFRQDRRTRAADDLETMRGLAAGAGFQAGDPEAVTALYRVHFRKALVRPEHLDRIIEAFQASFARGDMLKAWAVDDRLTAETHLEESYTLFPRLQNLRIPTLVVHGERDVVPVACACPHRRSHPGGPPRGVEGCRALPLSGAPGGDASGNRRVPGALDAPCARPHPRARCRPGPLHLMSPFRLMSLWKPAPRHEPHLDKVHFWITINSF